MRFVSSSEEIPNDNNSIITTKINKIGSLIQDENKEKTFAQMSVITDKDSVSRKYAIITYNNQPYDPYGTDSHREPKLNLVLKNVNEQTYTYYTTYLRTKNSLYMTRAQRSFING